MTSDTRVYELGELRKQLEWLKSKLPLVEDDQTRVVLEGLVVTLYRVVAHLEVPAPRKGTGPYLTAHDVFVLRRQAAHRREQVHNKLQHRERVTEKES